MQFRQHARQRLRRCRSSCRHFLPAVSAQTSDAAILGVNLRRMDRLGCSPIASHDESPKVAAPPAPRCLPPSESCSANPSSSHRFSTRRRPAIERQCGDLGLRSLFVCALVAVNGARSEPPTANVAAQSCNRHRVAMPRHWQKPTTHRRSHDPRALPPNAGMPGHFSDPERVFPGEPLKSKTCGVAGRCARSVPPSDDLPPAHHPQAPRMRRKN